ncbi:MAG: hydroxymethylbilane synthase [Actinomycetota bacterium]
MSDLRLATRRSTLAMAQAEIVAKALADEGVSTSLVPVATSGDRDRTSPVSALSEVGAFVRGVQQAVLDGRADVAIHSCKDLPVEGPAELVSFYPLRGPVRDVLCGSTPLRLAARARVGTGSPRRSAQLRILREDLDVVGVRGNVETRLGRVASGEVAAVVLAEAGLVRLGLSERIDHAFDVGEMVPAPAQGALAVEVRRSAGGAVEALAAIDDPATRRAVEAERLLLARTGAGCRSALGAHAVVGDDGGIRMRGFVEDERGPRTAEISGDDPGGAASRLQEALAL